jgi:hypothetical protein
MSTGTAETRKGMTLLMRTRFFILDDVIIVIEVRM